MIVSPATGSQHEGPRIQIEGRAWSCDGVKTVAPTTDFGKHWVETEVAVRDDFEWQRFSTALCLEPGEHVKTARAISVGGIYQPLQVRRNYSHSISIEVV